jgi:hypothetical protein
MGMIMRMVKSRASVVSDQCRIEAELTMMDKGDANMSIRDATLRYPTNVCRVW